MRFVQYEKLQFCVLENRRVNRAYEQVFEHGEIGDQHLWLLSADVGAMAQVIGRACIIVEHFTQFALDATLKLW